jgi:hypothetical protein
MLSAYLDWVGEVAAAIAQAIGQDIAARLNKGTDHWLQAAVKFCVFAVVYPVLTVGLVGACILLALLALKLVF